MSKRVRACRFCGAAVRYQSVFVGSRRRRKLVVLTIDARPHVDGRVVELPHDELQLLLPWAHKREGVVSYRVHSKRECVQQERGTGS